MEAGLRAAEASGAGSPGALRAEFPGTPPPTPSDVDRTSTWSPWRRSRMWCRWSGRTGRWCGGGWRRCGGRSGRGCGRCSRRRNASRRSWTRATSPFAWRRGSMPPGGSTGPTPGSSCSSPTTRRGRPRSPIELSRANGERRATEREVDDAAEAARRELPDELREAPALVVAGEGWHPGVIGIVASRLVERHHRPVDRRSRSTARGRGAARGAASPASTCSPALEACSEHLSGFGGHRAAAGLRAATPRALDAFREAFAAHADAVLGPEDLGRTERIDAMVGGAGLGLDLAEELERLAPFGMGNPGRAAAGSLGARVRDVRPMGEGKHARFSLHSGAHRALGVAFGRSELGVGRGRPGRRRRAARGQPLERRGRAAGRPARALPA